MLQQWASTVLIPVLLIIMVLALIAFVIWQYRRREGFQSLRNQLLLAFLGVATVSVGLVVGGIIWQIQSILTTQAGEGFLTLARSNSQRIVDSIEGEVELLRNLSKRETFFYQIFSTSGESLNEMTPEDRISLITSREVSWLNQSDKLLRAQVLSAPASSDLKNFTADFPAHTQILYIDQFGALQAVAGAPAPEHYYYGDQAWWAQVWGADAGRVHITNLQVTPGEEGATIDIVMPVILPGRQEPRGVIRSRFLIQNLGVFGDAAITEGGSETLALVDDTGLVVYSSEPAKIGSQLADIFLVAIEADPFSWGVDPNEEGNEIIHSHANLVAGPDQTYLEELGWTFVVEQPLQLALATAVQISQAAIFGGLLALVLAVLVGVWIARQFTRPIDSLTTTSALMAEGELEYEASVSGPAEFRTLAQSFNRMTERLRESFDTLEDRIQERTRALETSSDISQNLINILDVDQLLIYVVDHLHSEFDFYHTHIYLVEEGTGDLVMAYGYGDIGRQLKERGHRLRAGDGIVGTVASTNQPFLSNNVDKVLNFVRNALLPETNSELAVPLRKGTRVVGVLDIQSKEIDRFLTEEATLMQSIANQTAVVLDNIRLLEETQEALQEVERLNRQLTRESWEEVADTMPAAGYHFSRGSTSALMPESKVWLAPMKQAAKTGQLVKQTQAGNGDDAKTELAVPLILRNQVIGVLGVKREETPVWAEEELAAVEAVADQVARALENARLSKEQENTIEQLKGLDRLKSEFLTSMSHELRTPLNSIIGFADVLLQGIDGELPDLATNDIQLIYNSGQHLLALINDVLDLSKIEAERMELVLENHDLPEVVDEVLAASSSLIKDKPVEIVVDIQENMPEIRADKLRFTQVLLNLVSNSVKFTEEGTVTIKARISADRPDYAQISVIDTGIGIPPEKQKTIFDRFRQADSSTTRKYGGTGLGLAICKKLVEMHGGELGVNSEAGEGSEFYFTIPLVEEMNIIEG